MVAYIAVALVKSKTRNWKHYLLFASMLLTISGITLRTTFRFDLDTYLLMPGLALLGIYLILVLIRAIRKNTD
jgi:prepilin signal peptidase PulO-like enzyme (type II secretory pathway)